MKGESLQSLYIEVKKDDATLGCGTGFIVIGQDGRAYLISNYHLISGRTYDDGSDKVGQPRSKGGATPNRVEVQMPRPQTDENALDWSPWFYPVVDDNDHANWYEHPTLGRRVDVVALPITIPEGFNVYPYETTWPPEREIAAGPGSDVSIIGFPFGRGGGGLLGIWIHGFIATEPYPDIEGLPLFYVDSRTRPGQSGSPVILHSHGGFTHFTDGHMGFMDGTVTNLIGVYSGRINDQSDIGRAWKVFVIDDIINGKRRGTAGLSENS